MGDTPQGMRRRDREITGRAELDELLRKALVLRLAMVAGDEPYLVPLSYGYDGTRLYFHTALEGRKLDILRANPKVCFEVEVGFRVVSHPTRACGWSVHCESVVGQGRVIELRDDEERRRALDEIMRHYAGRAGWQFEPGSLSRTRVWAVEIGSLTGKRVGGDGDEDGTPQGS